MDPPSKIGHTPSLTVSRFTSSQILAKNVLRNGELILCAYKRLPLTPDSLNGLLNELAFVGSQGLLHRFRDMVTSKVHCVTDTSMGFFSLILEPPDTSGWSCGGPSSHQADKDAVLEAYHKLHLANVLHGSVNSLHTLIGLNGRVALINFEKARLLRPKDASTQRLLQQEMDNVKAMLGIKESNKRPKFQASPSSFISSGVKRKHEYRATDATSALQPALKRRRELPWAPFIPTLHKPGDPNRFVAGQHIPPRLVRSHPSLLRIKKTELNRNRKFDSDHPRTCNPRGPVPKSSRGQLRASIFSASNARTSSPSSKISMKSYVAATSTRDISPESESTRCEPPSPTTPSKDIAPHVFNDNECPNPNELLSSWRGFASFAAQEQPLIDKHIEAARPAEQSNPPLDIHSTWDGIPVDLEPFFGSWMGFTQRHEIPITSLGVEWGQWLTACAREYCRNQPGRVQAANQFAIQTSSSLQSIEGIPASRKLNRRRSF